MYEYMDKAGERVTVRSIRTLERLLVAGEISGGTPFRLSEESGFVPAALHPEPSRIAGEVGVLLDPPTETTEHDTLGAKHDEPQSNGSAAAGVIPPTTAPSHSAELHPLIGTATTAPGNPWRKQLPHGTPSWAQGAESPPNDALLVREYSNAATAAPMPKRAVFRNVMILHAGALAAGLVALSMLAMVGLGPLATLGSAAVTLLVARVGGQRLAGGALVPLSSSIWLAGALALLISTSVAGALGFLAAALSVGGLAWGLNDQRKIMRK